MKVLLAALSKTGLNEAEARAKVVGLDSRGLIVANRPGLEAFKHALAANPALVSDWRLADTNHVTLSDVVANFQPTVLIGTSGQPGCFTESLVREMAKHVERPAISAPSLRASFTAAPCVRASTPSTTSMPSNGPKAARSWQPAAPSNPLCAARCATELDRAITCFASRA